MSEDDIIDDHRELVNLTIWSAFELVFNDNVDCINGNVESCDDNCRDGDADANDVESDCDYEYVGEM